MKNALSLFTLITLSSFTHVATAEDLATIYSQAKANNPTLLQALARKEAAFEAINSSQSALLPQINLTAGYSVLRSDVETHENNTFTAGVTLSQELYQQSSWVNLAISEKNARQADTTYAAEQQNLILNVSTAYFDVLRANDNLTFIQAEKKAVARQREQTQQRFDVGLSAITDVHDAQAKYDTVLANEVLAKNQLINSYEGLRILTGEHYIALNSLNIQRFSVSENPYHPNALIKQARQKNLSLLAARINADIEKERITLASSGHLPSLSFSAGYNYSDVSQTAHNGINDNSTNDMKAGINLNLPLYSGGNTQALTRQAEHQYVAASQELEGINRDITKRVRVSYNQIHASIGIIHAYQQAEVSAQSALQATEAGFDVGTRTIVDVLDSTNRLFDATRNLANARYDYIESVLQLKLAVGTLTEQDILDINAGLVKE